jgi:Holliday junction resolvase RusA-like endonuclease
MITLELSVPPSANRIWRVGKGRTYLNPEYKLWLAGTRILIRNQLRWRTPLTQPVAVTLDWYRSSERGDLDNKIKPTLDALKGVVIKDDKQVRQISAVIRAAKKGEDAIVVRVCDLEMEP